MHVFHSSTFGRAIRVGRLVCLTFYSANLERAGRAFHGQCPRPGRHFKSYYSTVNKLWSYAWTGFLSLSVCLGLIVFLVIPSLVASVWLSLSTVFVVTQNKRGLEALSASKELVKGQWRQTGLFPFNRYANLVYRLLRQCDSPSARQNCGLCLLTRFPELSGAAALVALYKDSLPKNRAGSDKPS